MKPFASDSALIQHLLKTIEMQRMTVDPRQKKKNVGQKVQQRKDRWLKRLEMTSDPTVTLAQAMHQHHLSQRESEILTILAAVASGILPEDEMPRVPSLIAAISPDRSQVLDYYKALGADSRLLSSGLVSFADALDDLVDSVLVINPQVLDQLLSGSKSQADQGWPVKEESELEPYIKRLAKSLSRRSYMNDSSTYVDRQRLRSFNYKIDKLQRRLCQTLAEHPEFKLAQLVHGENGLSYSDQLVVVALAGRDLGFISVEDDMLTGEGLARALSEDEDSIRFYWPVLSPTAVLWSNGWIQPRSGRFPQIASDDQDLLELEYELTEKAREQLGIERRLLADRKGQFQVRAPQLSLDQLVLPIDAREELELAFSQAENADVLLQWGLNKTLPYGRGSILLFYGLPGTGKTACAEAIAHRLGKKILKADYTRIVNCLVGNTEKSIKAVFADAMSHDAVLLWDEADALFYNRNIARQSHESRFINVILQEIEAFEGICVLTTNRELSLDPALERRLSLKMHFQRPNEEERLEIWKRLVPQQAPMDGNVNFEALATFDLSGGEIAVAVKNALLAAVHRDRLGSVMQADFMYAIQLHQKRQNKRGKIGFRPAE